MPLSDFATTLPPPHRLRGGATGVPCFPAALPFVPSRLARTRHSSDRR